MLSEQIETSPSMKTTSNESTVWSVVPNAGRATVLVLEDDAAVAGGVARGLREAGYHVVFAQDGDEALRVIEHHHIDAAVLDYHVPGPNGVEVMERIAEAHPDAACVLVTGALDLDIAITAVNRGKVRRILRKPFGVRDVICSIADSLEHNQRISNVVHEHRRVLEAQHRDELLALLASDQLQLALQPIVAAGPGQAVAHEALLRSSHPDFRSPLDVLQACERYGVINELGALVAVRAAEHLQHLPEEDLLFINLHPLQLQSPDALRDQLSPLLPMASRVVIEITERAKLDSVQGWSDSAQVLVDEGFQLAADDLGSGYNSLALLAQLKPRFIKLDMSIVRGIHLCPTRQGMLELVCKFAAATGARVVAEGIEEEAEAQACVRGGADLLQGYYFGRPALRSQP